LPSASITRNFSGSQAVSSVAPAAGCVADPCAPDGGLSSDSFELAAGVPCGCSAPAAGAAPPADSPCPSGFGAWSCSGKRLRMFIVVLSCRGGIVDAVGAVAHAHDVLDHLAVRRGLVGLE